MHKGYLVESCWVKMKKHFLYVLFLSSLIGCRAQYLKFDRDVPGIVPKQFAKSVISANGEHVGYGAFNPDGSMFYYAVTTEDWFPSKLLRVSVQNLQKKDTLYLRDSTYEGEPFLSADGKSLFFMVVLPPKEGVPWQSDIYKAAKGATGWVQPELLDTVVNSIASEWHLTTTKRNIAYFTSEREKGTSALHGDIYKADWKNGRFVNRVKLPPPINTDYNDSDPLIAPDESFLIFHSDRPGGFGQHDLYITFQHRGEWTTPVNMGSDINTQAWEMAPSLTPDGKYLLFTRRKELKTSEPAKIFWVNTRILKQYKKEQERKKNNSHYKF